MTNELIDEAEVKRLREEIFELLIYKRFGEQHGHQQCVEEIRRLTVGTIYVALLNDRHADMEVQLFLDPNHAVQYAKDFASDNANDFERFYEEEQIPGFYFYARYSPEDDWVMVLERELITTPLRSHT